MKERKKETNTNKEKNPNNLDRSTQLKQTKKRKKERTNSRTNQCKDKGRRKERENK